MKSITFIFTLILISNISLGQNDLKTKKAKDFKLYSNFNFSSKYIDYGTDTTRGISRNEYIKETNGFNFSPSLVLHTKKGNSYEIEISRLNYFNKFNKEYTVLDSTGTLLNVTSGNTQKQFELYLRYEYKLRLFKNKDLKKNIPVIGFSGTPFVIWEEVSPLLSTEFKQTKTIIGFYLSIIPRVEHTINKRWYLDLNFPVAISTYHYTSITNDDPTLPLEERTINIIDSYNSPVTFAIRFGIGFRI